MGAIAVLASIFLWIIFRFASLALVMWFEVYYPNAADRIHAAYTDRGRRCVFVGLFNLLVWALVAILLVETQALALLGFAVLAALIAASVIGFAPAYRELGQRIDTGDNQSRDRNLIYGFLCLEAAFITPFAGQALAFGVLVRSLGAFITTILAMRRDDSQAPPETNTAT
jgi:hypothetical protein